MPGFTSELSPAEQLPFPEQSSPLTGIATLSERQSSAGVTGPLASFPSSPHITRQLPDLSLSPAVTHGLPEVQTGALFPVQRSTTTSLRQPVVIRGSGKRRKQEAPPLSHKRPRWMTHVAVIVLVALVAVITLITVLPESADGARGSNPFQSVFDMFQSNSNNGNMSLVAQRAATATAITVNHSGYDPGPSNSPPPASGSSAGDPFPYGQCTYWADLRYHQLAGIWVPWGGNADQWLAGARAYGWHVSYKPVLHSIVVLQPGVQGAGYVGHVAVVERINSDGGAYSSNMNFYTNGGGWGIESFYTFYAGSGVAFVYH